MKKSLIYTAAVAVVALSSCSTINNTAYTTTPEVMVVNMTVADIDVAPQQVTATTSWNWNPFRSVNSYKKNAEAIALRETGSDILVEPVYEVHKRGFLRGGSVTVTGHPGKFVNFRKMTEKDAEIMVTTSNKVGVATPIIKTSAPSFINHFKAPKAPKEKPTANAEESTSNSFVTLWVGGLSGDTSNGTTLGLMYGHYGPKWGWYAKATGEWGSFSDDYGHDRGSGGCMFTGGVIKTLPKHFNVFAGAGLGKVLNRDEAGGFAVPIEIGAQWNYKRINIGLGLQAALNTGDVGAASEFKYFVGVGYNF